MRGGLLIGFPIAPDLPDAAIGRHALIDGPTDSINSACAAISSSLAENISARCVVMAVLPREKGKRVRSRPVIRLIPADHRP
jgi:hypothetical protein